MMTLFIAWPVFALAAVVAGSSVRAEKLRRAGRVREKVLPVAGLLFRYTNLLIAALIV